MVNEPGRSTLTTAYKQEKLKEMLSHYINIKRLPESVIVEKKSWKPGFYIEVPNDGNYVINTEPVTIEFNSTPKKLNEILETATPIYQAAKLTHLKPYVQPAAERSGMGHIHVGGHNLEDSPFYKNENLLRNVLVFFHKHPSLLFGFAEAYDIGINSNIETLHYKTHQEAFEKIIAQYDEYFRNKTTSSPNGLLKLIDLFKNDRSQIIWSSSSYGWFAHYRFINIEHLRSLSLYSPASSEGKFTVEFRMFRPPPTPAHAEALAQLLVAVMDYLAKPNYLENFKSITTEEFSRFATGTKIQSDWEDVKRMLKLKNPHLDSMINELVSNIQSKDKLHYSAKGIKLFESYSEKEHKGKHFELRYNVSEFPDAPQLFFNDNLLLFEKIRTNGHSYWVALIKTNELGLETKDFAKNPFLFLKQDRRSFKCLNIFK